MNIALIGGSGFVGTRLCKRLLDAGHEVRILDKNDSISYPQLRVEADVRDIESLVKNLSGIEIVINLAAEHRDDVSPKSLYDDVNVTEGREICTACKQVGIKK